MAEVRTIPGAKVSPRIENGVLIFYEGDTFKLNIEIELKLQSGETVSIASSEQICFEIFDHRGVELWSKTFTGVTNNTIAFEMDEEMVDLFHEGEYSYTIYYNGSYTTTVAAQNKIVVERRKGRSR